MGGARSVVAHSWPIVDSTASTAIDEEVVDALLSDENLAQRVLRAQLDLAHSWLRSPSSAIPPHFWAGLCVIGPSVEQDDSSALWSPAVESARSRP